MNGWVYLLDNGKWDKIGDRKSCTISLFNKSNIGKYQSPNGMMTLTTNQIDGSSIVTHVFRFNSDAQLQIKGSNAWRLVVKQPNGNNATLAVRFLEDQSSTLFETMYKWIVEGGANGAMGIPIVGLEYGGGGGGEELAYGGNGMEGGLNNNGNINVLHDSALEMGYMQSRG